MKNDMKSRPILLSAVTLITALLHATGTNGGTSPTTTGSTLSTLTTVPQNGQTTIPPTTPAPTTPAIACGNRSSIVSGAPQTVGPSAAILGAWPWQALVLNSFDSTGTAGIPFGGTLLNEQWILTTTSALRSDNPSPTSYFVKLGSITATLVGMLAVDRIITHPRYSSTTSQYDLALLHLASPVTYTDYIRPICLPQQSNDATYGNCYSTGYGAISSNVSLRQVPISDQDILSCIHFEGAVFSSATELCLGASICTGDGGPVQCRNAATDTWTLAGAFCYTDTNCQVTVATRISAFADWIQQQMSPPTTAPNAATPTLAGGKWKLLPLVILAIVAI